MDTFDFPYHQFRTEYPQSGNRISLGSSYLFTSPPNGPDMRTFVLSFKTMVYYLQNDGVTIDTTKNPKINMAVLDNFYKAHKLYKSFIYPHPVYGNTTVKFLAPLKIPKGVEGGAGTLEDFEIELLEIQN